MGRDCGTYNRQRELDRLSLRRLLRSGATYDLRRCLRCEQWFRSEGPGNRRCDSCAAAVYLMGGESDAC